MVTLLTESRLKKILGREDIEMADAAAVEKITGASVGFAGPVGLKGIKIYADKAVTEIEDGAAGANENDAHIIHVKYGRDYKADEIDNLRLASESAPESAAVLPAIGRSARDAKSASGPVFPRSPFAPSRRYPRRTLAGRRMRAPKRSKTALMVMPRRRNGRLSSQTIG